MTGFGYLVANAYANWAHDSQKKLAQVRISDSLNALMRNRTTRSFWLQHWDTLSLALFHELVTDENDWYRRFELAYLDEDETVEFSFGERDENQRNTLHKFLGEELTEAYIEEFSKGTEDYALGVSAELMVARLYHMLKRIM
jgi:hypothetical protein